ncbi:MAG: TIGR02281 family clan AA aspartic protease, partial [Pseudomonadota bacterium]
YLMLLGTVIAGYFFVAVRVKLGETLRKAGLWVLIFLGAIVGYGLWQEARDELLPRQSVFAEDGSVEIARSPDGHFHMVLDINGEPVRFVVDTGATDMVLSRDDAARVGLDLERLSFSGAAQTANGEVATARVWLETVALGGVVDTSVPALVNSGEMTGSLLGMSYLDRFEEVSFGGGRMVLTR